MDTLVFGATYKPKIKGETLSVSPHFYRVKLKNFIFRHDSLYHPCWKFLSA